MSDRTLVEKDAESAIKERIEAYLEQLTTTRDLAVASDFYTEEATIIGPDTDMGRSGVVEMLRSVFEGGVEVQVNRKTVELFVHGNAAYEIAKAQDTIINPDGSSSTLRNNLFIRWARGTDGRWRFDRVLLSPQTNE